VTFVGTVVHTHTHILGKTNNKKKASSYTQVELTSFHIPRKGKKLATTNYNVRRR